MRPTPCLAPEQPRERRERHDGDRLSLGPSILIVAADSRRRAEVLQELARALTPETRFVQAGNVWEVLEHAPTSGVAMLAGDLHDVSKQTLTEMLGRRYPWLPTVVFDSAATDATPTEPATGPVAH